MATLQGKNELVGTLSSGGNISGGLGAVYGRDGESAYAIACRYGFEGSEAEWLESLNGKDGIDGTNGTDGKNGTNGTNGKDGISPTITVKETTTGHNISVTDANGTKSFNIDNGADGNDGTKGEKGDKGDKGDAFTYDDFTEEQLAALKGEKGADGTMTFEDLTDEQKASLKGDKGDKGDKGESGVYVGSGDIPEGYNIQIDPSGDADIDEAIPSYEGTAIGEKCAEFSALMNGTDKVESFVFFTDPHLAEGDGYESNLQGYLETIKNYYLGIPASFVVCGGDWLGNMDTQEKACFKLGYIDGLMRRHFDNYHMVVGNHDTNEQGCDESGVRGTGVLPINTVRNLWNRENGANYYSFDGASTKFYVLDTWREGSMTDYHWEQIAWLAEKLNTDDAENSALFLHEVFTVDSGSPVLRTFASNVFTLCQAYNEKTSATLNSVAYDFSACTGKVKFALSGHTHTDYTEVVNDIPVVVTTHLRNGNTPTFDMCLVDYDKDTLNMIRVGTGESRIVELNTSNGDYVFAQGKNFGDDGFRSGFNTYRMTLCSTNDTGCPIREYSGEPVTYYAALIPEGATKIKITCPEFKFGLGECDNSSGGYAWRKIDSGWQTSGTELTFSGNYTHFIVLFEALNGKQPFVEGEEYDVSGVIVEFS